MSRNLWYFLDQNRAARWPGKLLALGLVVVCIPALAFDEGGVPTVSKSTAEALKSFTGVNDSLAVPAASATIFDQTPPIIGTAESPDYVEQASSIAVSYSGMTDAASGLKRVTLWVRADDSGWNSTDQSLDTESGTFTFAPPAAEGTYHFHFLLEDKAGNLTPEPSGDGLTSTRVEGSADYTLSMSGDLVGQPGATIPCPVNINNTEGLTDYNVTVAFDAGLLEVDRVAAGSETGRLGWSKPAVTTGSGSVTLAASGHALRGGQGSIAIVYFTVKDAENGQTSPLSFTSATLNGGGATVNTRDGLFTVDDESFVWGDVDGDGEVTNEDSTLVLKSRAHLVRQNVKSDTSEEEIRFFLAGNVSGDDPPRVGTVDASLIMRHVAGAISRFPVDVLGTGRGPQDFADKTAVKESVFEEYGDPTETPRLISIPGEVTLEPGATFQVPVSVDMADNVRGYYFELLYDYRALELANVSSGSLTKEWILPIVNPLTGKVNVVGAHTEPASGEGTLAVLTFRVLSTVTPGATTRLSFENAELNDGLLVSQISTGMGEPVITGIEPSTGAESGGTVVRIAGANLGDVSRVVFGAIESPWVNADRAEGVVYALTPIGAGTVDVTVESPAGAGTLPEGFTFFVPQVHLTLTPEQAVESGNRFDVPVWIVDLTGGEANTVTFDLRFDPQVFTPIRVDGAQVTAEESALAAGKSVTAVLAAPGCLRVTVEGAAAEGIASGLLATCHLLAIAAEEQAQTLIYITNTAAEGPGAKALPTSASLIPE